MPPFEIRHRHRRGFSKIARCDPALRAAYLQERVPLSPAAIDENPSRGVLAGHLAGSLVGYFPASIPGVELAWAPERARQPEVEMGIPIGTERNPSEVNDSNRIDSREDTKRLRALVGRAVDPSPFGILPTMTEAAPEGLPEGVLNLPMVLAAAPAVGREPPVRSRRGKPRRAAMAPGDPFRNPRARRGQEHRIYIPAGRDATP